MTLEKKGIRSKEGQLPSAKPSLWSKERLSGYLDPGFLIVIACREFLSLVLKIVFIQRTPLNLVHKWSQVREQAFSNFWQAVSESPLQRSKDDALSVPTLEGSRAMLNPHFSKIKGVVLDLGPGTGDLTFYYPSDSISKMYGAEPNTGLHPALAENVKASGLRDHYEILSCGADVQTLLPGLARAGLLHSQGELEPVFDTIIAARVLCTLPHLEESLEVLYSLLKPGGKLLVVEHVINPWANRSQDGSFIGRLTQIFYKPWWKFFIQCNIDADTEVLLEKVGNRNGGWAEVELRRNLEWSTLSWIGGCYTK